MSYLATENARWGGIKRRLLQLYRAEFEEFINRLHIDYFYNGNYPGITKKGSGSGMEG